MEMNNVPEANDIVELLKQMEGVENNAFTMRLLAKIHADITTDHSESAANFVITMKVLEEVRSVAYKNLENMQKLPKEEQHYMYNGEISAQESFIKIVIAAFEDESLDSTARAARIQEQAEAHAAEAEKSVAEPLAQLRLIAEMAEAFSDDEGNPLNITIH